VVEESCTIASFFGENRLPRQKILIEGIVQGVGFRPFVFQLARRCEIAGWVRNDCRGVTIEAEGEEGQLALFRRGLREELPPLAVITRLDILDLPPQGEGGFVIRASAGEAENKAQIAPDAWVCPDCLDELFDPGNRRYRYPFINCTNCGPRYTIVTGIPYDRLKTTMADFSLCRACRLEYEDPENRRFHAQPNACPECGPRLSLLDSAGNPCLVADPAAVAVDLLRQGKILAVKGLGGYHLAVDAENGAAVAELRRRKARDEKPFALMSPGLAEVESYALFDDTERRLLSGQERPIVLLRQRPGHCLSPLIAPRNRDFGVMLPYTPLHHLLLRDCFTALVMTSGNLSDEPIAFENAEARQRLSGLADAFLIHNRRIFTRTDDSIARVMAGRPLLLRRSRGYVPRGILLPAAQASVLALGAELKNAICITRDERAFLGQHIGDLQNHEVFESFRCAVDHLQSLLDLRPQIVAHDLHPHFFSTRFALELPQVRRVAVQHHHAHLASCLAENGIADEALGVIFDGFGYGADGHAWGGEFLLGGCAGYRRLGHLAYLPMPGGDAATREPWRMAFSALVRAYGRDLPRLPFIDEIAERDRRILQQMMAKGINSPLTSSCGRLFDAVAALTGVRGRVGYEGQAALELEQAIAGDEEGSYPLELTEKDGLLVVDPAPLIRAVVDDLRCRASVSVISARFHNALAATIGEVCRRLRAATGQERVVLSGGVFQNRYLTERASRELQASGFEVITHSLAPPNDGGLALGQAVIAGRLAAGEG